MANEFNKQITKPSQLTTIAVLCLVDGILNTAYGLIALVSAFLGNLLALLFSLYCLTLGILEIRYAIGLFSDPTKVAKPAQYIPIMQIINVLTLNVFTLFLGSPLIGVVVLALHRTNEVRNYFQWRQSLSPIQSEKRSPEKLAAQVDQEMFRQPSLLTDESSIAPLTPGKKKVSGSAIASFVSGLLAWLPLPIINFVLATIATVIGINALHKIKESNGLVRGKTLAKLGLGFGIASCVVYILVGVLVVYLLPRALLAQGNPLLTAVEIVKYILEIISILLPRLLPPQSSILILWILQML